MPHCTEQRRSSIASSSKRFGIIRVDLETAFLGVILAWGRWPLSRRQVKPSESGFLQEILSKTALINTMAGIAPDSA